MGVHSLCASDSGDRAHDSMKAVNAVHKLLTISPCMALGRLQGSSQSLFRGRCPPLRVYLLLHGTVRSTPLVACARAPSGPGAAEMLPAGVQRETPCVLTLEVLAACTRP